ncbi:hypothetical protein [Sphingomonas sp.]|jgi:hypothetical protein|uniref:hypothetical protein n=1 Tax=Sphingomonas sp. TaxID=28214 RepID=UPI002ED94BE7
MLLPIMLLLQDSAAARAYAEYREKTSIEVRCQQPKDASEIVVCARRQSDRLRLPLVPSYRARSDMGDMRTARLLDTAPAPCGEGAFLVNCGSVGVGMTVSSGGSVRYVRRETAP